MKNKTDKPIMLNLGCGTRHHPDWINLDFVSSGKDVIAADLNNGIPYPDGSCDVVYHSHVLEHFIKTDAKRLVAECHRVLKPDGIIRIAVPDLEPIARNYLTFLERSMQGDKLAEADYDWTMLEMYDQSVRNHGGGEMKNYFKSEIPNKDFVKSRIGHFFDLMSEVHQTKRQIPPWKTSIKRTIPTERIRNMIKSIVNASPGQKTYKIGKFRLSGEVHQWMYDRFSLARLLKDSGFTGIMQRSASQSYIPEWTQYDLDTEPDGAIYKADSLFIEAKK